LTILCPSCGEKFNSFQKFKKLTKTLCHEHTHAIKKTQIIRVGESLGTDGEDRCDVSSTLKGLLEMSSLVFMGED
jgi:predicted nucleic acid-binding Zn ribbon protein